MNDGGPPPLAALTGIPVHVDPSLPANTARLVTTCQDCGHPSVQHSTADGCVVCARWAEQDGELAGEMMRCRQPAPIGGRPMLVVSDRAVITMILENSGKAAPEGT